jgi:hypothetical protein
MQIYSQEYNTYIYIPDDSTEATQINQGYDWSWDGSTITILGTRTRTTTVSDQVSYSQPQTFNNAVYFSQGADVASANDLTLGSDGNLFVITGSTQINAITLSPWTAGSIVALKFYGAVVVKHATSGGAGTGQIILTVGSDLTTTAELMLFLMCDGTRWREISRNTL